MDRKIVTLLFATLAAPVLAQTLPYDLPQEGGPARPADATAAPSAPANPFLQDETKKQAEARAAQQFEAMDLDHKGYVTADEMIAYFQARASKARAGAIPALVHEMMEDADTDHDGKISSAESKAAADRGFDEVDTNHDGIVTPAERMAAVQDVSDTRVKGKPQEVGR